MKGGRGDVTSEGVGRGARGKAHARPRHRRRLHKRGRAAVKGLVMGAMILGAQAKPKASHRPSAELPAAEVRVSIESLAVLPPYLAYDTIIEEAALLFDLDADLIHAVIEAESSFDARAQSPVGAQGLMQLMPALQEQFGVEDPFDPRQNIMAGSAYLKSLLDRHRGDVSLALAAYNAGPGNVARYRGVPPFKETRRYIRKIKRLLDEVAGD